MSRYDRQVMWMAILVSALLLAQSARAEDHPLELGDETIWLGSEPEQVSVPSSQLKSAPPKVADVSNSQRAHSEASKAPLSRTSDEPASQASAFKTTYANDPTPLPRNGAESLNRAESGTSPAGRGSASWTRTILSLGGVVALIGLLAWGYRLTGGLSNGAAFFPPRRTQLLEVIGRTSLSPRHSVCLVRAGGRVVLVGLSGDRMTSLDVIGDSEAGKLLGLAAQERSDSASADFERTLVEESAQYEEPITRSSPQTAASSSAKETIASTIARLRSRVGRGLDQPSR